ncbi:MAG: sulfur oxidation c-type cytochrome SoxA [Chitinophagaceae bacterium]|nr:sulfur oxidation c-type cytochrome SoxA [Rubrivivax sp.]
MWRPVAVAALLMAALLIAALVKVLVPTAGAAPGQPDTRRSGFDFMSPATQALQRDDTQNPGWLWLKDGEQRFDADCARCHTAKSMQGVAARYPAVDAVLGKPVTLAGRINQCRQRHMKAAPLALEGAELLGLETFVAHASRNMPVTPPADTRLSAWREQGRRLFMQRMGQLELSCAQCHDQHAGGRLAGSIIPQGHATGYPLYRLEWQGLGGLPRRLRNCMTGVRAEPFALGADELTMLELYLAQRAAGMNIESPAVRP